MPYRSGFQYDDVELALCRLVKKWMLSEEFRVMAICQFLPVAGRTLWLTKNQLVLEFIFLMIDPLRGRKYSFLFVIFYF